MKPMANPSICVYHHETTFCPKATEDHARRKQLNLESTFWMSGYCLGTILNIERDSIVLGLEFAESSNGCSFP